MLVAEVGDGYAVDQMSPQGGGLLDRRRVLAGPSHGETAAFADQQVLVSKSETDGRTVARVAPVVGEERVVELSRMLSGHPDSAAARRHAKELLAMAARSVTTSGRSGSLA